MIDDVRQRVGRNGHRYAGCVQIMKWVLASRIGPIARGTLETIDTVGGYSNRANDICVEIFAEGRGRPQFAIAIAIVVAIA